MNCYASMAEGLVRETLNLLLVGSNFFFHFIELLFSASVCEAQIRLRVESFS